VLAGLALAAILIGGVASWFASTHPDGLEWSIARVTGKEEVGGTESSLHHRMATLQEKTAMLPDYGFRTPAADADTGDEAPESWPAVSAGTSTSGIVGGLLTMLLAGVAGYLLRLRPIQRAHGNG